MYEYFKLYLNCARIFFFFLHISYYKFFESNLVILFLICTFSIASMRNTMVTTTFLVLKVHGSIHLHVCVCVFLNKKTQYSSHIVSR